MTGMEHKVFAIGTLDRLSAQQTAVHRLDPRAKLITTLVFITVVISFPKYEISALVPFALYPLALAAVGNIPAMFLIRKLLWVAPFAVLIGIFNPLLDREVMMRLGGVVLTGGWLSFGSILLRFTLTVGAALTLVAVTGFNAVCLALEKLGTPRVFVVQLLFLHRYMFVLMDEALRMVRARALRAVGSRGLDLKSFGTLAGQLLLRTMDRAQRVYLAMSCRGFDGNIHLMQPLRFGRREAAFVAGWVGLFAALRIYDVPAAIGRLALGLLA
jgi:cobalt/nickel transport system permease protein